MKPAHLTKGETGEKLAERFLRKQGLVVVATNFNSRFGEIDIICRDNKELIFVEVRFRSNQNYGSAAETVSIHKQRKVTKAAQYFLQQNPNLCQLYMRFDVIGVDALENIEWIKGAFQATV